jgi:hypothetical protein
MDIVAQAQGLERVVGHLQDRATAQQPGGQFLQPGAGDGVDGGKRFVHQDHRPVFHQGARQGDALPLAARQGRGQGVGTAVEPDIG